MVTWGMRSTPQLERLCALANVPLVRVEDGFLRSVGLGEAYTPGLQRHGRQPHRPGPRDRPGHHRGGRRDLSKQITVEAKGEVAALADTINTMVEQLRSFADEVTRVAREVGTEGKLGGQADVPGVAGTWRDLTDNVDFMAANLTSQVRNIAHVATAVANGDLGQKITVDAQGEILELKQTLNVMVDQLSSFADEVTRVAREVGTEGKLGGQARVEGVSGTWRDLTENVNQLAGNLTTQVRAIAEVSTAVTQGNLTRSITVEAQGEVAELSDNINQMIQNLRETTRVNAEQDWLKTNLARISASSRASATSRRSRSSS